MAKKKKEKLPELNTDSIEYKYCFEIVDMVCNWNEEDRIDSDMFKELTDIIEKYEGTP